MRRLPVVLGLLVALLLAGAPAALAEPPTGVAGQVTDTAGVLGSGTAAAQSALDDLRARTGERAYVVFVRTFDGVGPNAWAEQTAQRSRLTDRDVVLAVATQDRRYGVAYGNRVDARALQQVVSDDVEPRLSSQDWVGAVQALSTGLTDGRSSAASSSSGGGGVAVLVTIVLLLVLAGGGYLFFRSRRRRRELEPPATRRIEQPDPHAGVSTDALNTRASEALLSLDERVRTSQVDLDFAVSQYGDDVVGDLGGEMAKARDELSRAFAIRQLLDDDIPEDEPTRRRMLTDLLALTDAADGRLRAQAERLRGLRDREAGAPQALAELSGRVGELRGRLPAAQQRVADLSARYAASAVAVVADNPAQAEGRIAGAEQALEQARSEQAAGRAGRSVSRLRLAEDALAQADTLLDAVDRLGADLAAAEQRVAAAHAQTEADLAEARALAGSTPPAQAAGLQQTVARASAALAAADAALRPATGGPDPLSALRRLEEADAGLQDALRGARDAQTQARRAAAALDQAMLTARSAVAAADDFIATRRGAVGPEARTRLAEAQRHLDTAGSRAAADPVAALGEAQQADRLAQTALSLAQGDVEQWSQQAGYGGYGPGYGGGYGGPGYGGGYGGPGYGGGYGGPGYGGGYGGGYGRGGGLGRGLGWGLGGLVLGGLLFGDNDHDNWDSGGAFGDSWGGGDFGGGDFGSFGGDFGGGDGGSF